MCAYGAFKCRFIMAVGVYLFVLKALDTIVLLLKLIVCIKTYLVMSNGELLIVYIIERNGSL